MCVPASCCRFSRDDGGIMSTVDSSLRSTVAMVQECAMLTTVVRKQRSRRVMHNVLTQRRTHSKEAAIFTSRMIFLYLA